MTVRYIVSTVDTADQTRPLRFPEAFQKFSNRVNSLQQLDGKVNLNWENNDWSKPKGHEWLPPQVALGRVQTRLSVAKIAGIDAFIRGARGKKGPTYRIRSVELAIIGSSFKYSGEISARLRNLCDDVWAKFGSDNSLSNGGVHVCRKISGSSKWSQHSWYDAIDLMIGSDMGLGDEIAHFLRANEGKYGGYCELLWRVSGHYDHIHLSLAPCHTGTPPC